jgi:hypothetical protein
MVHVAYASTAIHPFKQTKKYMVDSETRSAISALSKTPNQDAMSDRVS